MTKLLRLCQPDFWADVGYEFWLKAFGNSALADYDKPASKSTDLRIRWPNNLDDADGVHIGLLDPLLLGLSLIHI